IVSGREEPAQQRTYADRVKEITIHIKPACAACTSSTGHVEPGGIPRGHPGECLLVITDLFPYLVREERSIASGCPSAAFGVRHPDKHKFIGVFYRQAAQGDSVKQLKDGCVGPYAERQRENGDG